MRQCPPAGASVFSAVLIAALTFGSGCRQSSLEVSDPIVGEGIAEADHESFDAPDAAAELYWAKRQVADGGDADLFDRYRRARKQMERMPRHSSKDGIRTRGGAANAETANLGTWSPLGPGNVGGRTRALLVDPTQPNVLYAAGVSGGIWKSDNSGQSWRPLADFLPNIAVSALTMAIDDTRTLYAGTGEGQFREVVRGSGLPLRGAGIFKSDDAGETWRRLESTAGNDFHWVNDLVPSAIDPKRIYAATRTGVWRTNDGGASWIRILNPNVQGGCFDLAVRRRPPRDDYLLATCGSFVQSAVWLNSTARTSPGEWTQVLTEPGMGFTSLAIAPSNPDVVYALSASYLQGAFNGGLHALFRSNQGGRSGSWTALVRNNDPNKVNTLLLTNPRIASQVECAIGSQNGFVNLGWYANVIAVDPTDPEIVFAGGIDLFRSDDGGRSWGTVSYWWTGTSAHADQHAIVFDPGYDGASNQRLYLGGDGGVYLTDNARGTRRAAAVAQLCDPSGTDVAWTPLNTNYGVTQFYHGLPRPDGESYFGGTQDNGTLVGSTQGGINSWQRILGGDGGYVAVDPGNPDTIYAEAQNLNLFKSTDAGKTFRSAVNGIVDAPGSFLFITPFLMDPSNSQRLWTGGRRLWRTVNGAQTWTPASAFLPPPHQVSAIAVAPTRPGRVLAATNQGSIFRNDVALATNASTSWQGITPRSGFVTWLAFDPNDFNVAYASYGGFGGNHLYRSADGGFSWASIDGGGLTRLPDIPVHSIAIDPSEKGTIYLGTDLGVFASLSGGGWAVENSGFPNVVTESLSLLETGEGKSRIFAFTHGRGAWKVDLDPRQATCEPQRWIVHLTPPGVPFDTRLFISNAVSEPQSVELVAYTQSGQPLDPVTLEIAPQENRVSDARSVFLNPDVSHFGICGSNSVTVSAGYRFTDGTAVTAQSPETHEIDTQFLFYPGEWQHVFDGLAIINVGSQATAVEAVLLDQAGAEVARVTLAESLAPHAKHQAVLDAEFLGQSGTAIRIESGQPAAVLLLRGTRPGVLPMLLFEVEMIPLTPRQ